MAVDGDRAYVGSGTVLLVVDVTTPASPQLVGEVSLTVPLVAIAAAGDHVYVVLGYDGLKVFSVANPAAPVEVGGIDTPGNAYDIARVSSSLRSPARRRPARWVRSACRVTPMT